MCNTYLAINAPEPFLSNRQQLNHCCVIKNPVIKKICTQTCFASPFVGLHSNFLICLFGCISSLHMGNNITIFGWCTWCATCVFLLFPPSEHRAQCYALLDKYAPEIVRQTGVQHHALAAKAVSLEAAIGHSGFVSVGISLSLSLAGCWPGFLFLSASLARGLHFTRRPSSRCKQHKKRLSGNGREEKGNECMRKNHQVEQSKQAPWNAHY